MHSGSPAGAQHFGTRFEAETVVRFVRRPHRKSGIMSFAFRLAFSLAVLGIVVYFVYVVDFGEALALLLRLHLPLVLVALAYLLVTYPTVQRTMLIAAYQGLLFPSTLAMDALRSILSRHHPRGVNYRTSPILTDRIPAARVVASAALVGISLAAVLFRTGLVHFLIAAAGTSLGPLPVLAVDPIIMLIVLLPISILGIGVQDSAFIFFFRRPECCCDSFAGGLDDRLCGDPAGRPRCWADSRIGRPGPADGSAERRRGRGGDLQSIESF
jgi:hypothetical protein